MILILSHPADPHVAMVTRHLDELDLPWFFVPTPEMGDRASVRWGTSGHLDPSIVVDGRRVEAAEVSSVWNRRLLRTHAGEYAADPTLRQFVVEQWWHALQGVLETLDAHWVNGIGALARARSKPRQLVDATAMGLEVPPTIVSVDLAEIREFAVELGCSALITKVVSPGTPLVADDDLQYMIFTQRAAIADLDEEAVGAAPAIYQPELSKDFEVRATVVGDAVLGCRIDSGASERTSLDWRRYDFDRVAHSPIDLPGEVEGALLGLCRHYGLRFAAADFIVQPDGRWIFLELNPNGQWGWIEERAGIPIGRHLAGELAREA